MRSFQLAILSTLLFLLCFISSSCVQTTGLGASAKASENVLRVGVSANSPPLIFKKGSQFTGLETDFARQLATYLGKDVKFVPVPWDKQLDYLDAGKTDIIMSGMTITNKRSYRINFSLPYLNSGQLMVSKLENKSRFNKGIYSLMNSKYIIGTIENTTGDYLITKSINQAKRKQFKKSKEAIDAIIRGDIDVFVYDAPGACYYAAMNEQNKLTVHLDLLSHENLAWGIAKENTNLLDQVNQFITGIHRSGELQKTTKRWIPYM